ncbi:MAG: hypothetical protein H6818_00515 [Phycisphaerales bacterium]|nr:hypothetical protein [Phycisphaerales bacterium]MCB9864726.1 hypothetical protein [Phycisphaerales bacterium]
MKATHPDGVPLHAHATNSFTGERIADNSIVRIEKVEHEGKWLYVKSGAAEGWISRRYAGETVGCTDAAADATTDESIVVGAWNLEWLKDGTKRGFPEFKGDDKLRARNEGDYAYIAGIIRDLGLRILILSEINGYDPTPETNDDEHRSEELEKIIAFLGADSYAYVIGQSGVSQRLAILYDTRVAHLEWSCEGALADEKVQGSSLYARQPLLGSFQLFKDGVEMNDLVVVGVHLASKQNLTKNHDVAMSGIEEWLLRTREENHCIESQERDILIAGDFNASRFDSKTEKFWDRMELSGWNVLADDASYPATRLSGNPPKQNKSQIDYVIVSKGVGALSGDEITQETATVHSELVAAAGGGLAFRTKASDHLPVTVNIRLTADGDPD